MKPFYGLLILIVLNNLAVVVFKEAFIADGFIPAYAVVGLLLANLGGSILSKSFTSN